MNPKPAFLNAPSPILIDGGTNSNLRLRKLLDGKSPEQLLFENPTAFIQLHKDFIQAGAQIILTATFNASPLRLEHANLRYLPEEINQQAVKLAQQAIQQTNSPHVLIAGAIGPCGQTLSPDGATSPSVCQTSYREQATTLTQAGVDLLLLESQFDLQEATLAVEAIRQAHPTIPLIVSFSYDLGQKSIYGVTPQKMAATFNHLPVDMLGINCGKSIQENLTNLTTLHQHTHKPILFKPNAGLPNATPHWETDFKTDPQTFATLTAQAAQKGAHLIGGCCGTTPAHIAALAQALPA